MRLPRHKELHVHHYLVRNLWELVGIEIARRILEWIWPELLEHVGGISSDFDESGTGPVTVGLKVLSHQLYSPIGGAEIFAPQTGYMGSQGSISGELVSFFQYLAVLWDLVCTYFGPKPQHCG